MVSPTEVTNLAVAKERMAELAKGYRREGDGKALRRDTIAALRVAVQPGRDAIKSTLRAWPSSGLAEQQPALGPFLASKTGTRVRLTGRLTGVSVRIPRTPGLRGWRKAATALNSDKGWRHMVFGHEDRWVEQTSPDPDFFDRIMLRGRATYRAAVYAALAAAERRIRRL
jgi:hypothetical protein